MLMLGLKVFCFCVMILLVDAFWLIMYVYIDSTCLTFFKVMDAQGDKSLALFPAKFQKSMWIKRGLFLSFLYNVSIVCNAVMCTCVSGKVRLFLNEVFDVLL